MPTTYTDGIAENSSLPPQCSVFSAEAAAIFRAATTAANKPILILTDSHSVVQAITSEVTKHPWIQAIIKYAPPKTVYTCIPGHCGVPGNESVDHLARAWTSGPRLTDKVHLQDVRRWIMWTIHAAWEAEWFRNRAAFIRKVKESTEAWSELDNLRDQRVISRLRTGHTKLYYNYGGLPFRTSCIICEFQNFRKLLCLTSSIRDLPGMILRPRQH
ncbi:uncharacterized protein LOC135714075 [Ochlerotatus camptorhynchus]|uniref:uncharacterized protein LOC135714075 n=1 Tax=Ochlerotatus camptorhynchus TaxID=644619 RepID=UPI0031DFC8E3